MLKVTKINFNIWTNKLARIKTENIIIQQNLKISQKL